MKIVIGKYKNWFGPYQLASALCFWAKPVRDEYGFEREPEWVHDFGQWLAGYKDDGDGNDIGKESLLYRFLKWVDSKKKRKIKIRIDKYDTWNMDATLALIILPMLKQLKETKQGSQGVDMADVPESMRLNSHETYDDQLCFDFYHEDDELNKQNIQCDVHDRWDWVMGEMIWAFEQIQPGVDWEAQYVSGTLDTKWKKSEKTYTHPSGKEEITYEMVRGPNDTFKINMEGRQKHQDRINNGFRLFGKYYQGLWD
jgi:hypothetical protein